MNFLFALHPDEAKWQNRFKPLLVPRGAGIVVVPSIEEALIRLQSNNSLPTVDHIISGTFTRETGIYPFEPLIDQTTTFDLLTAQFTYDFWMKIAQKRGWSNFSVIIKDEWGGPEGGRIKEQFLERHGLPLIIPPRTKEG